MALIQAATQIRWLTIGLTIVLTFLTTSFAVRRSKMGDAGTESTMAAPSPARDASAESAEIERMIASYAKSIDDADTNLASQIWSDLSEVSFIHPLGHEHGLEQIKQNVYEHLMGETFSERELRVYDISAHVYGDTAWAEFYWDFAAKFRKDDAPITTHGRETQVYRKEKGRWRLVHAHYSGMPINEERQGF